MNARYRMTTDYKGWLDYIHWLDGDSSLPEPHQEPQCRTWGLIAIERKPRQPKRPRYDYSKLDFFFDLLPAGVVLAFLFIVIFIYIGQLGEQA